mmetsp:Transcript_38304/g.58387  ORF Transcript_38304/g.58387 Transcript_38304/m.58387 type:complete len:153 (-) Transcript_38304:34-492(-)
MNLSGSANNSNILQGDTEIIDNPEEMEALEAEEDMPDDPETLEEMERRRDEIIERFIELSHNKKHEEQERLTLEFQENHPEIEDIDDCDELEDELASVGKAMDKKRKEGLKKLKAKINLIVNDETLHSSVKLQKLYENAEIDDYISSVVDDC